MAMKQRKAPARWRKWNNYNPTTYRLYRGMKHLATAQKDHRNNTWFWYGLGRNTALNPRATFDEIKADVAAFLSTAEGQAAEVDPRP